MKVEITRKPSELVLDCGENRGPVLDLIGPSFTFSVPGAEWSPEFDKGFWDGKKRLLRRGRNGALLSAPPGLFARVVELLGQKGFEVEVKDLRPRTPWEVEGSEWSGHQLYPFQEQAVSASVHSDGGILFEPIRSGKTLMAAAICHQLGQKSLFVAPSDFLVAQARDVFRAALKGPRISLVGLGEDDWSGNVVVASIATLSARRGTLWWQKFRKMFGVVFFDELHHLLAAGVEWRAVAEEMECHVRFGLTGTLDVEQDHIRLTAEAICGPVLHKTSMSELAALRRLVPLTVTFLRHDSPSASGGWQEARKSGIAECAPRNRLIASRAKMWAEQGNRVLIDCALIGHSRRIFQLLAGEKSLKGRVQLLTGSSPQHEREDVMMAFRAGRVPIVISTVLGEGVDIPELEVVINAEGGAASPSTIQRLRQLTPSPGKDRAYLDDFVDSHHPILASHTRDRLRLYKARGFAVEVQK